MVDKTTGELTEDERKKLKLPKDVPMVESNGDMLITLDQPVFIKIKNPQRMRSFTDVMKRKQIQYMDRVHNEVKKRNGRPRPIMPMNDALPFDIFVIEFKITPEDENDCESE